ncbi:WxL domain-containing protein [Vagococcus vulneris]|uniref:WxL domain-containing protein n=1 Tax=Vagococcus vulneris TaxID=1977869 RepID=A0A429ZTU5_9ENTE|nr:WxL domain-containing protein [Vagococcus vulneris]RST97156.1 hypothetical protein CBF37_10265 [Vagococcus vulneris]
MRGLNKKLGVLALVSTVVLCTMPTIVHGDSSASGSDNKASAVKERQTYKDYELDGDSDHKVRVSPAPNPYLNISNELINKNMSAEEFKSVLLNYYDISVIDVKTQKKVDLKDNFDITVDKPTIGTNDVKVKYAGHSVKKRPMKVYRYGSTGDNDLEKEPEMVESLQTLNLPHDALSDLKGDWQLLGQNPALSRYSSDFDETVYNPNDPTQEHRGIIYGNNGMEAGFYNRGPFQIKNGQPKDSSRWDGGYNIRKAIKDENGKTIGYTAFGGATAAWDTSIAGTSNKADKGAFTHYPIKWDKDTKKMSYLYHFVGAGDRHDDFEALSASGDGHLSKGAAGYYFKKRNAIFLVKEGETAKDRKLKQILVDTVNNVAIIIDLYSRPNWNMASYMSLYNLNDVQGDYGITETNLLYGPSDSGKTKLKASTTHTGLGVNLKNGDYPETDTRYMDMTYKFKSRADRWLSDYGRYMAYGKGVANNYANPKDSDIFGYYKEPLAGTYFQDPFGDDLQYQYKMFKGYPVTGNIPDSKLEPVDDRANTLGAGYTYFDIGKYNIIDGKSTINAYQGMALDKYKPLNTNDHLKVGYETFFGDEVPMMTLDLQPNDEGIDVYGDQINEKMPKYTFKISAVPTEFPDIQHGRVVFTMPNGTKKTVSDSLTTGPSGTTGNYQLQSGDFYSDDIERPTDRKGKKIETEFNIIALSNDGDGKFRDEGGIPSNDFTIPVNVYHLGAKAKELYIYKKDEDISQLKPKDLLKDIVSLPGSKLAYSFIDKDGGKNIGKPNIDTSNVDGNNSLQRQYIRVVDSAHDNETVDVPVPFISDQYEEGQIIIQSASDFEIKKEELEKIGNQAELNRLILERANAFAIDTETNSSDGITFGVSTALTPSSSAGDYKADITASKFTGKDDDKRKDTKHITIKVIDDAVPEVTLKKSPEYKLGESVKSEPKDISSTFIDKVTLGGKELTDSEYDVKVTKPISTDTAADKKLVHFTVSMKAPLADKKADVEAPYDVKWGDAIGYGTSDPNRMYGAIAFLRSDSDDSLVLRTASGKGEDNDILNKDMDAKQQVVKFGWYNAKTGSKNNLDLTKNQDGANADETLVMNAGDKKQEALKKNAKLKDGLTVHVGDVIFSTAVDKQWLYRQNLASPIEKQSDDILYYEITKDGYEPLYVNLYTDNEVNEIHVGDTHKQLDEIAHNFIKPPKDSDPKNVTVTFAQYPKTNVAGESQGVLRVTEKLSTGDTVSYDYQTKFDVKPGDLAIGEESSKAISFGDVNLTGYLRDVKAQSASDKINVTDKRGSKDGWKLTVQKDEPSSNPFGSVNSKGIDLYLSPQSDNKNIELSDKATLISGNTKIANTVANKDDSSDNESTDIKLNSSIKVSGRVKKQTYHTNLLWTLQSVPSATDNK